MREDAGIPPTQVVYADALPDTADDGMIYVVKRGGSLDVYERENGSWMWVYSGRQDDTPTDTLPERVRPHIGNGIKVRMPDREIELSFVSPPPKGPPTEHATGALSDGRQFRASRKLGDAEWDAHILHTKRFKVEIKEEAGGPLLMYLRGAYGSGNTLFHMGMPFKVVGLETKFERRSFDENGAVIDLMIGTAELEMQEVV